MWPVTTPPRVSRAEVDEALRRIAARHRKVDDEKFSLIEHESAGQVLEFIERHPTRVPWVDEADIYDGLVLWVWEQQCGKHQLLTLLNRGHKERGMPLKQLGSPLGLGIKARKGNTKVRNRRQGVLHLIDRLTAWAEHGVPDATRAREERRARKEIDSAEQRQVAWLVRNHDRVVAVARRLLSVAAFADEEAKASLEEVERDLVNDEWSPASLSWMRLAAGEMRVMPEVLPLPSQHRVMKAIHAVDELSDAYSHLVDLGSDAEPRLLDD